MKMIEGDNCENVQDTRHSYIEKPTEKDIEKLEHKNSCENNSNLRDYNSNGYHYRINDSGQILQADGDLRLEDGKRNNYAQRIAGGDSRREEDDGGHLIANRFGGSGGLDNLIPEDKSVNRGGFKALENNWADNLKDGKNVHVEINPIYHGDSQRPDTITGRSETDNGNKKEIDYFSMTNDNLESDEFKFPDDDPTDIYPNAMDYDHSKYDDVIS